MGWEKSMMPVDKLKTAVAVKDKQGRVYEFLDHRWKLFLAQSKTQAIERFMNCSW